MLNYDTPSHILKLYLTTVRTNWNMLALCGIKAVERVQKFAIKDWHSSYDNLLNVTNIPTLYSIQETATQALSLSFS